MPPPFHAAPRRDHALKSAHSRAVRRPPLTLAVPSGDRQPHGMSRSDTPRSGAAVWRDLRIATQAAPAPPPSAGTAALARRGSAIWEQVPRSAIVRHDVASLSARCLLAGSATARYAVGSQRAEAGLAAQRPLPSSLWPLGICRQLCMRLHHIWCQSLTAPHDLPCQPPPTLRRAARGTLKSASVVATQGSAVALTGTRGSRSPSGMLRSGILRNSTAIQRVLSMAARRAHKSERGERRRGASRDGGLRRNVARGTC